MRLLILLTLLAVIALCLGDHSSHSKSSRCKSGPSRYRHYSRSSRNRSGPGHYRSCGCDQSYRCRGNSGPGDFWRCGRCEKCHCNDNRVIRTRTTCCSSSDSRVLTSCGGRATWYNDKQTCSCDRQRQMCSDRKTGELILSKSEEQEVEESMRNTVAERSARLSNVQVKDAYISRRPYYYWSCNYCRYYRWHYCRYNPWSRSCYLWRLRCCRNRCGWYGNYGYHNNYCGWNYNNCCHNNWGCNGYYGHYNNYCGWNNCCHNNYGWNGQCYQRHWYNTCRYNRYYWNHPCCRRYNHYGPYYRTANSATLNKAQGPQEAQTAQAAPNAEGAAQLREPAVQQPSQEKACKSSDDNNFWMVKCNRCTCKNGKQECNGDLCKTDFVPPTKQCGGDVEWFIKDKPNDKCFCSYDNKIVC